MALSLSRTSPCHWLCEGLFLFISPSSRPLLLLVGPDLSTPSGAKALYQKTLPHALDQ